LGCRCTSWWGAWFRRLSPDVVGELESFLDIYLAFRLAFHLAFNLAIHDYSSYEDS
jgi:hypothetical protein